MNNKIEFNEEFKRAYELMEHSKKHVFITGKAGTGKSTLLKYFKENSQKRFVVLAPTGVAAVNIGGQTIHSFFNFKPDITPYNASKIKVRDSAIYKELDLIIIDEISMVRADLLDAIDIFLRKHGPKKRTPFGGIRMVFIGDLYQLPPVLTGRDRTAYLSHYKSPYFYEALVFSQIEMEIVELMKIYRQKDQTFVDILNRIRNGTVDDNDLAVINSRVVDSFSEDDGYIYLTPTNEMAYEINLKKLEQLDGKLYSFQGQIEGEFALDELPAELNLELKVGAQVMLLNNDVYGRWVNGTIGRVVGIYPSDEIISVKISGGDVVELIPYEWDIFKFSYNKEKKIIQTETIGFFVQYPLKLAYAITIHKSQGKTFDKVVIDLGRGIFSPGQLYVALSRCTSLDGIVLKKPIKKGHVMLNKDVIKFLTSYQYRISEKNMPLEEKVALINKAIEKGEKIEIVYLKAKDEKSRRVIEPIYVGDHEYGGKTFPGLTARCCLRNDMRVFRIDRILEINQAN